MYPIVKRVIDLTLALLGVILLFPLLAIIAAVIKIESRGPALYKSHRVGLRGEPFVIYKFRTMFDSDAPAPSSTAEDDPRITRVGRFLRAYKLDELPQLLNTLKGDMSLVGPRPQVAWAVELYSEQERRLLAVRPGMADYAVLFLPLEAEVLRGSKNPDRDYMTKIHPEKMRLSLEYLAKRSLLLDLRIMLDAIGLSFFRRGIVTDLSRTERSDAIL